jgi:hypothetical protein
MEKLQINSSSSVGLASINPTTSFDVSGSGITSSSYSTQIVPNLMFREPTKQELLMRYNISIEFINVGCIVSVGCKKIAFSSAEDAIKSINKYVNNPKQEAEYWEGIFGN